MADSGSAGGGSTDGKIVFSLEVDDSKVQSGVSGALSSVESKIKAANKKIELSVSANTTAANGQLSYTQAKADNLDLTDPNITVSAQTGAANQLLSGVEGNAKAVEDSDPTVTVTADTASALQLLTQLQTLVDTLSGDHNINVNGGGDGGGGGGKSGGGGGGLGGGLGGAVGGVVDAGVGFAKDAFEAGVTHEAGMLKAMTLMPEGTTKEAAQAFGDKLLDLAAETGQGIDTLWEATYNSLSASQDFGDISGEGVGDAMIDYLRTSAQLAIGGFTDVNTAGSTMAKTINAYGTVTNEETGETQNRYTPEEIADILVRTQNKGITTVGELGQSLSHVTGTAANAGVGFDQVGAMMATLTAQGVNTAEATTKANNIITEMLGFGLRDDAVGSAFNDKYGGKSFTSVMQDGDASIVEVLQAIKDGVSEDDQDFADQGGWYSIFSSKEAAQAAEYLMNNGGQTYADNLAYMNADGDAYIEAYETVDEGMGQTLEKLQQTWMGVLTEIGVALAPIAEALFSVLQSEDFKAALKAFVDAITSFLTSDNITAIITAFTTFATNLLQALSTGDWSFLGDIFASIGEMLSTSLQNVFMGLVEALLPIINGVIDFFSDNMFFGNQHLSGYKVVTDANGNKRLTPKEAKVVGMDAEGNRLESWLPTDDNGNPITPGGFNGTKIPAEMVDYLNQTNGWEEFYRQTGQQMPDYGDFDPSSLFGGKTLVQASQKTEENSGQAAESTGQTADNMESANEASQELAESAEENNKNYNLLTEAQQAGAELSGQSLDASLEGLESATANNEATGEMATANGEAADAALENCEVTGEMAGANSAAAGEAVLNAQEAKKEADATGDAANAMQETSQFTSVAAYAAHRQSDELSRMATGLSNGAAATNAVQSAIDDLAGRLRRINVPNDNGGGGGSFAVGLDNVPYDGFVATLHRGETVLNRAEAAAYRFKGGSGVAAIDYGALASAMAGMTVQMDGRVVGRLVERSVSTAQGERYGRAARNY